MTTLAALDLGLVEHDPERVHGHVLTRRRVAAQLERLAALPVEERRKVPGLEPERAPVIVAGAVMLGEIARPTGSRRSRCPSATSSTALRSRRPSCPPPPKATRLPAPTPAADGDATRSPRPEHRALRRSERNRRARPRKLRTQAGRLSSSGITWASCGDSPPPIRGPSSRRRRFDVEPHPRDLRHPRARRRRPHVLAHQLATLDALDARPRRVRRRARRRAGRVLRVRRGRRRKASRERCSTKGSA